MKRCYCLEIDTPQSAMAMHHSTDDQLAPITTRVDYQGEALRYASDLTDAEWRLIEPYLPIAIEEGRQRKTNLRPVIEVILYMASSGCQCRAIPRDFDASIESGVVYISAASQGD